MRKNLWYSRLNAGLPCRQKHRRLSFSVHISHFHKMKITKRRPISQGSPALKLDFGQKAGKRNGIIFAVYAAQFRASVLICQIPINAAVQIKMNFFSVTPNPFGLPASVWKILSHKRFDAHSIKPVSKRQSRYFLHFVSLCRGSLACLLLHILQRFFFREAIGT